MNDGGCGSNSGDVLGSLFFVKETAAQKQREMQSRVAGGSRGWQVAGLMGAQGEAGDRMMSWGYLPQHFFLFPVSH